jgi:hypothetical protein
LRQQIVPDGSFGGRHDSNILPTARQTRRPTRRPVWRVW